MNRARLHRAAELLTEAMEEPVTVHGIWGPLASGELQVFRWVYSYPTWRLATLEHWRDEGEWSLGGEHVVAMEASKVARLMLKGYKPAAEWFGAAPNAADRHGANLVEVCRRCAALDNPADRFAVANAWLESVRKG